MEVEVRFKYQGLEKVRVLQINSITETESDEIEILVNSIYPDVISYKIL